MGGIGVAKSADFGRGSLYRIGDMCVGSLVNFFGFLLLGPSSPSASLFLSVYGRLTLAIFLNQRFKESSLRLSSPFARVFGRGKQQHRDSMAKTQPAYGHGRHLYVLEEALLGLSLEIRPFSLQCPLRVSNSQRFQWKQYTVTEYLVEPNLASLIVASSCRMRLCGRGSKRVHPLNRSALCSR